MGTILTYDGVKNFPNIPKSYTMRPLRGVSWNRDGTQALIVGFGGTVRLYPDTYTRQTNFNNTVCIIVGIAGGVFAAAGVAVYLTERRDKDVKKAADKRYKRRRKRVKRK